MEKFNLLDFIARLGEACLKSRPISAEPSSAADPDVNESVGKDKNGYRQPPSFSKKPTTLTGYPQVPAAASKPKEKPYSLSPYGEKDMTDSEKALVQMIRNHDKLSKAIDEKLSPTEEK